MNKTTALQAVDSLRNTSKGFSIIIKELIDEYNDDEIDWDTYIEQYGGIYTVFNSLARYMEELLRNKENEEIQSIFNLVENWHLNGDELLQEATTIGFLEEIISLNPEHHYEDEEFLPYMGKETEYWLKKVKGFWDDGTIIKDDRNVLQGTSVDSQMRCSYRRPTFALN
jgi:hypothetical protein